MTFRDLRLRVRALLSPRKAERELDEELAFHIEHETQKYIANGLMPAEARRMALSRFGSVPLAADQCRDERGIGFLETLGRDVSFALRTIRRAPLVALTVVSTIALGLGVVTVAFTFFNAFLFRVDAVRNPEELFGVERPIRPGSTSDIPFTREDYKAMRRETSVFTDIASVRTSVFTRIEWRPARGMFVSGNFFDMLGVTAVIGRTLTPEDDEGAGRAVVVMSQHGWEKYFAADPNVVGRQFFINGHPFQVAGVMPKAFRGLSQEPQDYWAPIAFIDWFSPSSSPNSVPVEVIGRLKPDVSVETAATALTAWASARGETAEPGNGIVPIILYERRGVLSQDRGEAMVMFMPILFAFGLILMIGCANIGNLLLARGLMRHREIGVRLSLGASRARLVRQLLTENLLLAFVAAAFGFLVSRALLAGAVHMALSLLPPEFTETIDVIIPPGDWRVALFLLGGASIATLMFGLVPALHSTRLELVRAMRGEVTRDARPNRVRQWLIGSQVTASALLLVCAAVFLRGTYVAATADAGIRADDTIVASGITESARPAVLHAMTQQASSTAVGAAWPAPLGDGVPVKATASDITVDAGAKLVSPNYFDLLGIDLLRGRVFAPDERSASAGRVVLSQALAQRFWPAADPLGKTIRIANASGEAAQADGGPQIPDQLFTVIGVVRDVRGSVTTFNVNYSGIYLPTSDEQPKTSLVLRVHGDPDAVRRSLLEALTKVDPSLGNITTMRTMARLQAAVLEVVCGMAVMLGALALALTISGLFSVISYLVEQRRREIGVRIAIGASPRDIVKLVLAQSMRPIALGVVAGGALAAVAAVVLLTMPEAEMLESVVRPFDPFAYAVGLAVIVVTCLAAAFVPARRAARINATTTLRAD